MLEAALRYPTTGGKGLERLLVGGVLSLLGVLVIPAFLVYGYLVRCLGAVAAGDEEPPAFDRWEEMFVDGLQAFVVVLGYAIVPAVIVLAMFVPVSVGVGLGGDAATGPVAAIVSVGLLLAVVVAIAVVYAIMAAISNFAVEGRLGAAFDLRAVGRLATSEPYVLAAVLAIAVQVVLGLVIAAAVLLTFGLALLVLVPLGAFLNFWVALVTVHLFGAAYRETLGPAAGD